MSNNQEQLSFYRKMAELQEKLRKSEEERAGLEAKFQVLAKNGRMDEARQSVLRQKYSRFLEDDRRRKTRNERILNALDKVEKHTVDLTAKTERLRLLRRHFDAYMARTYPDWRDRIKRSSEATPAPPPQFASPSPNLFQPPTRPADVNTFAPDAMSKESQHFKSLMRDTFKPQFGLQNYQQQGFKKEMEDLRRQFNDLGTDLDPVTEFNTSRDLLSVTLDDDDVVSRDLSEDNKENNPIKEKKISPLKLNPIDTSLLLKSDTSDEEIMLKKLTKISSFEEERDIAPRAISFPEQDEKLDDFYRPGTSMGVRDFEDEDDRGPPEPLHRLVPKNLAYHRNDMFQLQPHHLNYIREGEANDDVTMETERQDYGQGEKHESEHLQSEKQEKYGPHHSTPTDANMKLNQENNSSVEVSSLSKNYEQQGEKDELRKYESETSQENYKLVEPQEHPETTENVREMTTPSYSEERNQPTQFVNQNENSQFEPESQNSEQNISYANSESRGEFSSFENRVDGNQYYEGEGRSETIIEEEPGQFENRENKDQYQTNEHENLNKDYAQHPQSYEEPASQASYGHQQDVSNYQNEPREYSQEQHSMHEQAGENRHEMSEQRSREYQQENYPAEGQYGVKSSGEIPQPRQSDYEPQSNVQGQNYPVEGQGQDMYGGIESSEESSHQQREMPQEYHQNEPQNQQNYAQGQNYQVEGQGQDMYAGGDSSGGDVPQPQQEGRGFKEMELEPQQVITEGDDTDTLAELDSSDLTATVSDVKQPAEVAVSGGPGMGDSSSEDTVEKQMAAALTKKPVAKLAKSLSSSSTSSKTAVKTSSRPSSAASNRSKAPSPAGKPPSPAGKPPSPGGKSPSPASSKSSVRSTTAIKKK